MPVSKVIARRPSGSTQRIRPRLLTSVAAPGPWLLLAATVAFLAVELRPNLSVVAYLDDSSVHQQMVRFATRRLAAGHLPWTSWFPFLGLGSPQFLHYQSLPATLTGVAGLVIGPDHAFGWSLYLLMATWPLAVYASARLFGLDRWSAAAAAALSPFLASYVGVGYEQHAYIWTGFGVWTQLWAMWFLPLAWALTWRAADDRRFVVPAALATAMTVACHFETGYLAALGVVVVALLEPRAWRQRLARLAAESALVLGLTAWATLPLLVSKPWAATNEPLSHTALENGYGARRLLEWLLTGSLLDYGRLPVITVLAAAGVVAVVLAHRRYPGLVALIALGAASFVLSFGRTTFGPLIDLVPEHQDLFFRRFSMGAQLAAVFLAGAGLVAILRLVGRLADRALDGPRQTGATLLVGAAAIVLGAVALLPPALQYRAELHEDAVAVSDQVAADHVEGTQLDHLLAIVRRHGGGRVYAGTPYNWGSLFTVGEVPVFKYLESQDIDEVGYTLRTASLMTDAEYYFDDRVPAEYSLFGIRYLVAPRGDQPPVAARRLGLSGPYALWTIPGGGYVHVGELEGSVQETRSDLGVRSVPYLTSHRLAAGRYEVVHFESGSVPAPRLRPPARGSGAPGVVVSQGRTLEDGHLDAVVALRRRGVVVLSATYDPGWHATVDGRPATVLMLRPAVMGVEVPAGHHEVRFFYVGFGAYPELFALAISVMVASVAWWLAATVRGRRGR